MATYDHATFDRKWQQYWEREHTFATPTDRTRPKYYVLDMFPYPSGDGLHVGHPRGYTATDVIARAKRMMGFNVLRVMGWDSFGLPAERRAERDGIHPSVITARNIAIFKSQLEKLGLSYDWARELATSDPRYYKWTQWIFELLFERGLAYRAEVPVNFCPALGTVLANEEVHDGKYIETGDPVEKRLMTQWMLRITAYADRLVEELDGLDWPAGTDKMQRDWIGKSIGANATFTVVGTGEAISVFTTRPDTLFGGTYVVLAPEHPVVARITTSAQRAAVTAYCDGVATRSERERTAEAADAPKTGVATGAFAINPVNGAHIPIWVADYVLASYGTGAVFACPAHDERDWAFAKKFGLPIVEVVTGGDVEREAYLGDGAHVNSAFLDGLDVALAKEKVIAWLEERGLGERAIRYRLRDWLFSRQRYWGEPFPTILDGLEGVLEERVRADAVALRAARRDELEARGVLGGSTERHRDLAARDRERLDEVARRRLPQPVADLVVVGLDLPRLDDVHVIAQAVEELRPVCLRIDRLQLDALDEDLPLGPVRLGIHVETADALPDAGHVGEGTEILQGMGVDVGRLGIDVVGIVAHCVAPSKRIESSKPPHVQKRRRAQSLCSSRDFASLTTPCTDQAHIGYDPPMD